MKKMIGIPMALMMLVPASSMVAADTYTMYRLYKNPEERAVVMQKVREARTVAQKKLQAGAAYVGERAQAGWTYAKERAIAGREALRQKWQDPELRAAALNKAQALVAWEQRNRKRILATAVALAAITAAAVAGGMVVRNNGLVLRTFTKYGIPVDNKKKHYALAKACLELGTLALQGTQTFNAAINENAAQRELLNELQAKYFPNFEKAIKELKKIGDQNK